MSKPPTLPDFVVQLDNLFCGCGLPEEVWMLVRDYLQALRDDPGTWPESLFGEIEGERTGLALFFAYVMDTRGFTEHGGSVFGSWLTEDGKRLLAWLQDNGADWSDTEWVDSDGVYRGTPGVREA